MLATTRAGRDEKEKEGESRREQTDIIEDYKLSTNNCRKIVHSELQYLSMLSDICRKALVGFRRRSLLASLFSFATSIL